VKYERIKFLVIAMKNAVEVYAWAPKPYHKFMAFKVDHKFFLLSSWFIIYSTYMGFTGHYNLIFFYFILGSVGYFFVQHIKMISEGSFDTEDWSNDAENSALSSQE